MNFLFINTVSLVVLSLFFVSCQNEKENSVPIMQFEEIEPFLNMNNDTVYVINFWATWCKPCIKELPDFEKINKDFGAQKVKVILVSLDFPHKHDELLIPFIDKHELKSQIIHLADLDANKWIDKVNPDWSGAIPATLIYKGDHKEFFEQSMTYEQIKLIVEHKL